MNKKTIRDIKAAEQRALVRVDFNVPLKEGKILDDTRMTKALPTIKYLQEQGARVILMTHLGRPKGQVVPEMSVKALLPHLSELLGEEVLFAADCGGTESQQVVKEMKPGQVALLENVRFYAGEEKNEPDFAKKLAALGDFYVNDAFGTAHRAHASTEGITQYLPAVAGFLMEKEIAVLSEVLEKPAQPFVVILGGAKVSDKISVIENLLKKAACLLIGGAMAHTFLSAQGYQLGASKIETDKLETARELLKKAKEVGVKVVLPQDLVVAEEFSAEAQGQAFSLQEIPEKGLALDIGPKTIEAFRQIIAKAQTIVWNGPLGVYEFPQFAVGTNKIAQAAASSQGKTVIGGGDVVAAVEKAGLAEAIYHISTGGGASLEFLEGKVLPGVAALLDQRKSVVAANWKMYKTVKEGESFLAQFPLEKELYQEVEVVVCPPFTALQAVEKGLRGTGIKLGGQNLYPAAEGAFTGEISPAMLKDLGCTYVILGHSERRHILGEQDEFIHKKVKAAFANELIPILCVGETLEQRQEGKTEEVCRRQVLSGLGDLESKDVARLVIAYEPVWAIGTGVNASPADAEETIAFIRSVVEERWGREAAAAVRIQYGGSVKPGNIRDFMKCDNIDGALVGGASLQVDSFYEIIQGARRGRE